MCFRVTEGRSVEAGAERSVAAVCSRSMAGILMTQALCGGVFDLERHERVRVRGAALRRRIISPTQVIPSPPEYLRRESWTDRKKNPDCHSCPPGFLQDETRGPNTPRHRANLRYKACVCGGCGVLISRRVSVHTSGRLASCEVSGV